ncbi:MAG: 2,4'-dihydroxyacetophenone dioxygenase family protein [Pseudomonadota bacterium]
MSHDDVLLQTHELPWVPIAEGIDFRLLRASTETGTWTVVFRCQEGSTFARHRHLAAGEYFVIKGRMNYRAGTAVTGDYGYEPLDSIHDCTVFEEYTELLFTNHGPVVYLDDDDNITAVLDHQVLSQLTAEHSEAATQ